MNDFLSMMMAFEAGQLEFDEVVVLFNELAQTTMILRFPENLRQLYVKTLLDLFEMGYIEVPN